MIQKARGIWLFMAKALLVFVIVGVFFIGQNIFYPQTLFYYWGNYAVLLLYAANLYLMGKIYHGFDFGVTDLHDIILSWILCLVVANGLQYLILSVIRIGLLPLMGIATIIGAQIVLVIPLAIAIDNLFYRLNPAQNALIIFGKLEKAHEYRSIIEKHRKKFKISQTASQDEPPETIQAYIKKFETVFLLDVDEKNRENLIEYCFQHNKRTYILPTFSGVLLNTAEITWISNTPMFLPKSPEQDMGARFVKRCMDLVISVAAIILSSWLMLIIWIVTRIYDRHPAIYKQTRVTKGGKHFTLYKFRSMRPDAEADGVPRLTSKNDNRVTPFGRFIRKTRFDELPQLFNVLAGSMSFVGPRPERPEISKLYEEIYPNFPMRTKVKAGITGFAQIYGQYNTAPDEKLFLDLIYIEKFSLWLDIKLILQTLKVILTPSSTEGIEDDSTTALR